MFGVNSKGCCLSPVVLLCPDPGDDQVILVPLLLQRAAWPGLIMLPTSKIVPIVEGKPSSNGEGGWACRVCGSRQGTAEGWPTWQWQPVQLEQRTAVSWQ